MTATVSSMVRMRDSFRDRDISQTLADKGRLEWIESRKALRAEAPVPVCIWERSPSPPPSKKRSKRASSSSESSDRPKKRRKREKEKEKEKEKGRKRKEKDKKKPKEPEEKDLDAAIAVKEIIEMRTDKEVELPFGPIGPLIHQPTTSKHHPPADPSSPPISMLPGEGEAMNSFILENKRIPRRGEVGLTADDIEKYEGLGYVMSGSRNRRMNAVRIRKESQLYSAEEKRILAQMSFEEKAQKENELLANFRDMVNDKIKKKI